MADLKECAKQMNQLLALDPPIDTDLPDDELREWVKVNEENITEDDFTKFTEDALEALKECGVKVPEEVPPADPGMKNEPAEDDPTNTEEETEVTTTAATAEATAKPAPKKAAPPAKKPAPKAKAAPPAKKPAPKAKAAPPAAKPAAPPAAKKPVASGIKGSNRGTRLRSDGASLAIIAMMKAGKTRKEIIEMVAKQFGIKPASVGTKLSDAMNPKYNWTGMTWEKNGDKYKLVK